MNRDNEAFINMRMNLSAAENRVDRAAKDLLRIKDDGLRSVATSRLNEALDKIRTYYVTKEDT